MSETDGKLSSLLNKNILPLSLLILGLIFFGYGLLSSFSHKKDKPDILFEAASDVNPSAAVGKEIKEIAVDVEGAVMKPGVYKFKENSRMQDALIAAGGMSDDADRAKVAKTINLASKILDGTKVYIPFVGDSETISSSDGASETSATEGDTETININTASSEELDTLPGIGQATAAKIIDNRPYGSIQELLDKKVVGKSTFDKLKDKIGI
jgi:competence protein ComEA